MKLYFLIFTSCFLLIFCSSGKYSKLDSYYSRNKNLHKDIAVTLHEFVTKHNTEITMRQKFDADKSVSFGYYFDDINTIIGIGFDSLLNRENPFPERTSKIDIPLNLIRNFKKTNYHAILASKEGIFFGFDYFTNSEYEYGVLIYNDENKINKGNVIKSIEKGVCIYKAIIP